MEGSEYTPSGSRVFDNTLEGTAEWPANRFETGGMVTHGGSIPLPSSRRVDREVM